MIFLLFLSLAIVEVKASNDWYLPGECYSSRDTVSCKPHEFCEWRCVWLPPCKGTCKPKPGQPGQPGGGSNTTEQGGVGSSCPLKCGEKCCNEGEQCLEHKSEEYKKLGCKLECILIHF